MPALIRDGEPVEIRPGDAFVDAHGIGRSANFLTLRSPAEIAETGARMDWPVEPPAAPEGKVHRATGLVVRDGAVVRTYVVEDVPPPAVPEQVPMWAAQAALEGVRKYEAVNAAILGMKDSNPPVYFAWTMGNFASRQSAFIDALAERFGMTDADIDAVFRAADEIARVAG